MEHVYPDIPFTPAITAVVCLNLCSDPCRLNSAIIGTPITLFTTNCCHTHPPAAPSRGRGEFTNGRYHHLYSLNIQITGYCVVGPLGFIKFLEIQPPLEAECSAAQGRG